MSPANRHSQDYDGVDVVAGTPATRSAAPFTARATSSQAIRTTESSCWALPPTPYSAIESAPIKRAQSSWPTDQTVSSSRMPPSLWCAFCGWSFSIWWPSMLWPPTTPSAVPPLVQPTSFRETRATESRFPASSRRTTCSKATRWHRLNRDRGDCQRLRHRDRYRVQRKHDRRHHRRGADIISGNRGSGVEIGEASLNVVAGNWIGVDATGASALANATYGVSIQGASAAGNGTGGAGGTGATGGSGSSTTSTGGGAEPAPHQERVIIIGGTAAGSGNVISGNSAPAESLFHGDSGLVAGNWIGTDATGTAAGECRRRRGR